MGDATNVAFFASFLPRSASQKPIFDPCTYRMADKPIFPKSSLRFRTMVNPALPNFGEYNLLARRDIRGLHFLGLLFLCCGRRATVISCCQCQQGCPRASLSSHRYPRHTNSRRVAVLGDLDTLLTYRDTVLSDRESLPTYRGTGRSCRHSVSFAVAILAMV